MKYLIPIMALSLVGSGCVVKKDSAASAAVSAEIAKQLAKSVADPSGAMGSLQGTSASLTASCTINGTSYTCKSDGYEMQMSYANNTISGYQKMTGMKITAGGKTYTVNGTVTIGGAISSSSSYNSTTGQYSFSSTTTQTMNGTISISGSDNFDVEYKDFSIKLVISGTGTSFNFSFSCGGKLIVDTIQFPVNNDCSI